ncbi:MAG: hypothetical protein DME99_11390 [Verrucomicrobia bacterium]|nr:MAG: hypothetical protein DME99_11390 [Verrucomicrobiota bacterium]
MKYHDGSRITLGDIVTVPVPGGAAMARVVMLRDTYEHLDIHRSLWTGSSVTECLKRHLLLLSGWTAIHSLTAIHDMRLLVISCSPSQMSMLHVIANKALQRTRAGRFSFMSHSLYNIVGFGGRALPALVAELGR